MANREYGQPFKEMLIDRVAGDVVQDEITKRLEVLGK